MKAMNIAKRYGAKMAAFGGVMALPAMAMAALPDTVKNALDSAKADGLEAGWLVIGVLAAIFVIGLIRKVMR